MEVSLNSTNLLTSQGSLSNASLAVAGATVNTGSTNNNQASQSSVTSNQQIQPSPIISVNEQGGIESPFIDITQEISTNQSNSLAQALPGTVNQTDRTNNNQLRELISEQLNIQERQQSLESEQQEIEQEIDRLQQRELEINRKKFELQRQSSLGNIINISI